MLALMVQQHLNRAGLRPRTAESGLHTRGNDDFFNGIRQKLKFARRQEPDIQPRIDLERNPT